MKALLLIDLQNDFLPGGALAVPQGDAVIPVCNNLQQHFDLVVATQDWHPPDHKSFAVNHEGKKEFETIEWNGLPQVLWPVHCVQSTRGAAFSDLIEMAKVEVIFRKGTNAQIDSYSGFYDNGHLKSTGLAHYLKGKGITGVYVAGLAADYCVYFTALDALAEGFETFIVEDATRAIDRNGFQKAKADFTAKGGVVLQSSDINKK